MNIPPPSFDHLLALSDDIGTFEHADHITARPAHGYCTDDMARVLVVASREPDPTAEVRDLAWLAFRFLARSQGVSGEVRNRRIITGRWLDQRGVGDWWGRTVWAFGTAARLGPDEAMRQSALAYFGRGVERRSPWPRAMAFAALGAAEVLACEPANYAAHRLLVDAVAVIGSPGSDAGWPWPESRLTYANAVLPEALLAAGAALDDAAAVDRGLDMLSWLLTRETLGDHLSPTPAGGSGPGDGIPRFDQQPIEVAAMADACARAFSITGDERWREGLRMAVEWFAGANDAGAVMWDPATNGGYDGLRSDGPNLNQGAESTLALVATLQHGRRLALARQ